ncbi:MAG: glycoside hydrolase family 20 zincin-like fold domain-containing protein [Promethearchaeota archaeon]
MKFLAITGLIAGGDLDEGDILSRLCPRPRSFDLLGGSLMFGVGASAVVSDAGDSYLVGQLNEELEQLGGVPVQLDDSGSADDTRASLGLSGTWDEHAVDDPEGYILATSGTSLAILAGESAGLFYGLQTLYQLFAKDGGTGTLRVPGVLVVDYPAMAIRGLSDDISRGQSPSVEAVKRYVKFLSRFKLNTYQFYTEDTFAIEKYPQIGKGRGPFTPAAVAEIQEFAKRYHVEVVPIYQTLGHMENILSDPELRKYAEFPGSACLNLGDESIYQFLGDLLSEVAPAFESRSFHIGCDESWDVGVYGGREFVEGKGKGAAYRDHYLWVLEKLKKLGKTRVFLYHDIAFKYDEVLQGLPKDGSIVFVYWDYSTRESYPNIDPIKNAGLPFVVSSSVLSWTKPFPDWRGSLASNRALITEGLRKGAVGQINSSWGDNGQENFRENQLLGWAYSSAFSWNPDGVDDDEANFVGAFFRAYLGTYDEDVARLYDLLARVWEDFPTRFRSRYLGHLWRHPYPRPDLAGEDAEDEEDEDDGDAEHWEVSADLHYHPDDMDDLKPLYAEIVDLARGLRDRGAAPRNPAALDYYEYAGLHMLYFVDKIQTSARVTNLCRAGLDVGAVVEVERMIEAILGQLADLRGRYEALWLNCASRPMLDRILRFYDWQAYWQREKIRQVKEHPEVPWVNPYIESEWIWFEETERHQEPRYFRGKFALTAGELDSVKSAHLQLAPGNHGTLWVNGTRVGEAQTSSHLSAVVIDHSVEFWDVKGLLREGENVVAASVTNFFLGNPVVNVYGEVEFDDGTTRKVLSDEAWKASASAGAGDAWTSVGFDDSGWANAGSKGRPPKYFGEISLPRFGEGWKSKITHHGYCRILRAKAEGPVSDFFDDFFFFSGNVL